MWALDDYGFRVVIAPSFADIFFNNAFKSGLLPLVLDADILSRLAAECSAIPGYRLSVDLEAQRVTTPGGDDFAFAVDSFRRHCLLNGFDDIELTLQHADAIRAFEAERRQSAPWLFA